jgi:hypothetical protein|tara:strand:+ start:2160 stop:2297 length:138 start_codon:yes stop_codon:yes gene_type:complete
MEDLPSLFKIIVTGILTLTFYFGYRTVKKSQKRLKETEEENKKKN